STVAGNHDSSGKSQVLASTVVLPYQVLSTITITTALSFDTARRNEGRVLFYPLLVREDLKQR
ncbi:hypothetical protein CUMW_086340, partial [Citrus unshiu]